jgi:hypothetical protein
MYSLNQKIKKSLNEILSKYKTYVNSVSAQNRQYLKDVSEQIENKKIQDINVAGGFNIGYL